MSKFADNTFQGLGRISAEGRDSGHLAAFLTALSSELDYRTLDANGNIDGTENVNDDGSVPDSDARPRAVLADTSGGTVACTLPDAATNDGRVITVVRIGASNATVVPAGSDTINGGGTVTITVSYGYAQLVSLGGEWVMLDNRLA